MPVETAEREYLRERAGWLVRLNAFAVVGIGVATGAAALTGFVQRPANLAVVGLALATYTLVSWRTLCAMPPDSSSARLRRWIFGLLVADMGALALLTHFSGGAENPFQMLLALPAAIGAILLARRQVVGLGVVGASFEIAVVLGQFSGVLHHHGLHGDEAQGLNQIADPLYRSTRFVAGYLLAFFTMFAGVIYLVRAVAERYQQAEALRREHDRVAESRERLARVGELSAGVAHAVRNPLHGLLNSIDLLRPKVAGDAEAEETLALNAEALGRIEGITRRLLSLTRDVPVETAPCDVDRLVADTLKFSSRIESKANVETSFGGVGVADLDSHRVAEALSNLVDNALHACRNGGTVTVRTFVERATNGEPFPEQVGVEVADSGEGIPEDQMGKVFDPFFTTKAVGEGTGLGLAIARRVAEEHAGRLSLESTRGRGTKVCLLVPRRSARTGGAS